MKAPTLPISSRTVDFDPDEKTEESQNVVERVLITRTYLRMITQPSKQVSYASSPPRL